MTTITVIDALMGSGKTRYMFDRMSKHPQGRYIYIGVNLGESERCRVACRDLDMKDPVPRHGKKYWDLYQLARDHKNVASTHQLFRYMDTALYDVLKGRGYSLIIDEAMDVVSEYDDLKPADDSLLRETGAIYVDEKSLLRWNHVKHPRYDGKFNTLVALCDNGNLVQTRQGVLMWQFPASFLQAFTEVYVCTYMFEGQPMADFFKANGVHYELMTLRDGVLVPHASADNTAEKQKFNSLIRPDTKPHRYAIGRRGIPGVSGDPLTRTWYDNRCRGNASQRYRAEIKQLKNATMAFFKEHGESSRRNMWTTFKDHGSKLKGPRYGRAECFVPMNTKATDKLKDRTALAYLVDRRQSPIVTGYFEERGIAIREDLFSLTELVQWIWRSCIRKDPPEPIRLYLPSERMRTILTNWIRYSDAEIVAGRRLDVGNDNKEEQREAA